MAAASVSKTAKPQWHSTPADRVLMLTRTGDGGLTAAEAAARLARDGPNALAVSRKTSLARLFLRQFKSPLIYLLLVAAGVSLSLEHFVDAAFIGVILITNSLIGAAQERKAAASLSALRQMIGLNATVRRDGAVAVINARDIVIGDLVEVESGMAVPADVRLTSSRNLQINQSTFSGESAPVEKDSGDVLIEKTAVSDQTTMLLAGTMVDQGRGAGVVVATGERTELGAIDAALRSTEATPPPLIIQLTRLARQISIATVLLVVPFAIVLVLQGRPGDQVLILAVALAVSAIPEGLSIAVTVALAAGSQRMANRRVIVRSLPAVEGLGACTLIASDKTGTLTQNVLTVERVVLADGTTLDRSEWPSSLDQLADIRRAGAICNEASVGADGGFVGDSVDTALLRFANDGDQHTAGIGNLARSNQLPYEPARKYSATVVEEAGRRRTYVKGAPEVVLPMCATVVPEATVEAAVMANAGFRILALAASGESTLGEVDLTSPHNLVLLGWVGLIDPVRPEVPAAIAECAEAGIGVRMVTGDHPGTALTIARELGIEARSDQVVTGAHLANLADRPAELTELVLKGRVFARIEPNQKLQIVQILAASGELVAVTGDGVNDAPALHAAHIGVAMGVAGTDAARGAADLVLADDNFASIVSGIEEGRVTYANVRKIVLFLVTTSIAEIGMFLGAVATGLPMPLTAVQLLWLNLVTNGAQDVMLGFGRGEGDELKQAPRRPSTPLLDRSAMLLMIPPALTMTGFALLMVSIMQGRGDRLAEIQNGVLLMVVLFQNVFVLCMRSERRPFFRESLFSNPWLLLGVGIALGLQLMAMFWGPLGALLGTAPVSRETLVLCLAAASTTLAVTEVTKWAVARRQRAAASRPGSVTEW